MRAGPRSALDCVICAAFFTTCEHAATWMHVVWLSGATRFAPPNAPERDLKLPLGIRDEAASLRAAREPVALLGGLYEEDVHGVYARGGLVGIELRWPPGSVLAARCDDPGRADGGRFQCPATGFAPRPLALVGMVDGLNRAAR